MASIRSTPTEVLDEQDEGDGAEPSPDEAAAVARTVRGRSATILVNEAIRSIAWEEDGAYWALEVECERPFDDGRCTEDAYLLGEAEALVDVRGAR